MSWLSFFRIGKAAKKQHYTSLVGEDPSGIRLRRREAMVTVDLDSFAPECRAELTEEIVRRTALPLFEGSVTHGYSKVFSGNTEKCPRCGSPTQQQTAHFIYATDIACRAMLVPAGFFCLACRTVIVDEQMISTGMKAGYRFRRVVGVDHFGKKDPDYFGTWNGEKPTYILDENEQVMDMVVESEMREPGSRLQARPRAAVKQAKAKRKQADRARRRNRKKR
ncbi:MAG: hypothetical protein K9N49_02155 [Candidatus Marinimicrobia bacterium]|nr:hypothetical protein [Candidatus Neomarinimicrobiota bacterium]